MDGLSDLLLPGTQWDALRALIWAPFVALAIDWWRGEPPAPIHPVVWMGKALGWCGERWAPLSPVPNDWRAFWSMALAWCTLAATVTAAPTWVELGITDFKVPMVVPAGLGPATEALTGLVEAFRAAVG